MANRERFQRRADEESASWSARSGLSPVLYRLLLLHTRIVRRTRGFFFFLFTPVSTADESDEGGSFEFLADSRVHVFLLIRHLSPVPISRFLRTGGITSAGDARGRKWLDSRRYLTSSRPNRRHI